MSSCLGAKFGTNWAYNTESDPNPKSDKRTVSGMISPPCMPNGSHYFHIEVTAICHMLFVL